MSINRLLNNFTGGEITPQLDARIDLQKYDTSCHKMQNMRPLPWGGATMRGGSVYVAATKDSGTKKSRLLSFQFNTTTVFLLELGDLYMRFFSVASNGTATAIMSGMSPYEIVTPYLEAELNDIQFVELNDVMYLVHELHPPQKLSRIANTNWTLTEVPWKYPPLLDENLVTTETLGIQVATAGFFIVGTSYRITTVGSTNFTAIGASANTVGILFTATGAGSGTGEALQTAGNGAWMNSSSSRFTTDNIGGYWELRHIRDASRIEINIALTSGAVTTETLRVKGAWTFTTTERWWGVINIQRSTDGGATWEVIRQLASKGSNNYNDSGTQDDEALFRLQFFSGGDPYSASIWAGTPPTQYVYAHGVFEVQDAYIAGLVKVTAINSATQAVVEIIHEVEKPDPTTTWSEGVFSISRGFPRAVGLYEQRLLYAGTTYKPNTIWGSVAAGFDDFTYSDQDDAAVAYQFAASEQNPIQWLVSLQRIVAGTTADESSVGSGNTDEPLTPSNVTVRAQSNQGSQHIQPLCIGKSVLFVQRQGVRIREFKEGNPYVDNGAPQPEDVTILAEHITVEGVVDMAFARLPDPTVYVCLGTSVQRGNQGQLAVMTYNREQNITAWARYVSNGGVFESVAVVYGSPADNVFVIVKRTINGAARRFIERLTPEVADTSLGVYSDASSVYAGSAVNAVTGLSYLEGERVSVVADGCPIGNAFTGEDNPLTVTSGAITLPDGLTAGRITVGLPYAGELRPMRIDLQLGNGTSQGKKRRIKELVIRFKDTLGCRYGNASRNAPALGQYAADIPFRSNENNLGEQVPLFTGDKVLTPLMMGNDLGAAESNGEANLVIVQNQPLPMTVLGIFANMDIFGD